MLIVVKFLFSKSLKYDYLNTKWLDEAHLKNSFNSIKNIQVLILINFIDRILNFS